MHSRRVERFRLMGVDSPETRGQTREAGLRSRTYTAGWLAEGAATGLVWPYVVRTEKDPDNFGRFLVWVWRLSDGRGLNADLIAAGMAVVYTP